MHVQLNKRIVGSRDAESILAIVEAQHGEFDEVNAATACHRLAKVPRSYRTGPSIHDRRVQTLFRALIRLAPSMQRQCVANTLWALATLGWQAGEGAMRC